MRKIAQLQSLHQMQSRSDANLGDYEAVQSKYSFCSYAAWKARGTSDAVGINCQLPQKALWRVGDQSQRSGKTYHCPAFDRMLSRVSKIRFSSTLLLRGRLLPRASFARSRKSGMADINTEYVGSPKAWMDPIAGQVRQYVKSFNTNVA